MTENSFVAEVAFNKGKFLVIYQSIPNSQHES